MARSPEASDCDDGSARRPLREALSFLRSVAPRASIPRGPIVCAVRGVASGVQRANSSIAPRREEAEATSHCAPSDVPQRERGRLLPRRDPRPPDRRVGLVKGREDRRPHNRGDGCRVRPASGFPPVVCVIVDARDPSPLKSGDRHLQKSRRRAESQDRFRSGKGLCRATHMTQRSGTREKAGPPGLEPGFEP